MIGGRQMPLEENRLLHPSGMSHEFWHPVVERATLILKIAGANMSRTVPTP
jgi:hypothetical protein